MALTLEAGHCGGIGFASRSFLCWRCDFMVGIGYPEKCVVPFRNFADHARFCHWAGDV
jgi:hypothetical protein